MARSPAPMAATPTTPAQAPGRGWYVVAALLGVAGWAGMALLLVRGLGEVDDQLIRVVVPGQAELRLQEPGTYTIFHEYSSTVDGRVYAVQAISGLLVELRAPGGRVIELQGAPSASYSFGSTAGRSLFSFELRDPGSYRLVASYSDRRREPQTVLTVGRGVVGSSAAIILRAMVIGFGGTAAGAAVAAAVYRRRREAGGSS